LPTRPGLIREVEVLTREFMAYAVLFQDAVARAAGLNSTDMQALGLLASQGPTSPGQLARRTGVTAGGAITLLIDRLEKAGFARRSRDQQDRRRVLVCPDLEQIEERVQPLYAPVGERWRAYLDTLTAKELATCLEFLRAAVDINRELLEEMGRAD
jgi:DNA-binding MarR family transcriptional regulator